MVIVLDVCEWEKCHKYGPEWLLRVYIVCNSMRTLILYTQCSSNVLLFKSQFISRHFCVCSLYIYMQRENKWMPFVCMFMCVCMVWDLNRILMAFTLESCKRIAALANLSTLFYLRFQVIWKHCYLDEVFGSFDGCLFIKKSKNFKG